MRTLRKMEATFRELYFDVVTFHSFEGYNTGIIGHDSVSVSGGSIKAVLQVGIWVAM